MLPMLLHKPLKWWYQQTWQSKEVLLRKFLLLKTRGICSHIQNFITNHQLHTLLAALPSTTKKKKVKHRIGFKQPIPSKSWPRLFSKNRRFQFCNKLKINMEKEGLLFLNNSRWSCLRNWQAQPCIDQWANALVLSNRQLCLATNNSKPCALLKWQNNQIRKPKKSFRTTFFSQWTRSP